MSSRIDILISHLVLSVSKLLQTHVGRHCSSIQTTVDPGSGESRLLLVLSELGLTGYLLSMLEGWPHTSWLGKGGLSYEFLQLQNVQ